MLLMWKLVLIIKMSTSQDSKTIFKYNLTCIFLSLKAQLKKKHCPRTPCEPMSGIYSDIYKQIQANRFYTFIIQLFGNLLIFWFSLANLTLVWMETFEKNMKSFKYSNKIFWNNIHFALLTVLLCILFWKISKIKCMTTFFACFTKG